MRTLPSQLLNKNSSAEELVFKMLRRIDWGAGAIALHSLNLPRHQYKRWAEADFIIIAERGILLLEVKGGRVACKDGVWEFENRFGEITRKNESPSTQAKTAFFSLRDNYLGNRFRELASVPAGWGVVFTGIDRPVPNSLSLLPDQPDEITAYRADCVGHSTFSAFLEGSFDYWSERTHKRGRLSGQSVRNIATFLRPNFEQVPPLANRLDQFGQDLAALTNEQYERLDEIQENERIMVRGGAGTGKTFLAMASARYDCAKGNEVLLVTRSRHLIHELQLANPPTGLEILAYDDLASSLQVRARPFDSVIIDEAQDLCQFDAIELLDKAVASGLEKGRWRWFGDPNRQVSESHPFDEDVLDYFSSLATKCRLKHNVRNAPKIVKAINLYVGADVGAPPALGQGSDVVLRECEGNAGILSGVISIVRSWIAGQDGARRSDVGVLVPTNEMVPEAIKALAAANVRAERLIQRPNGKVRDAVVVAEFEEFKGLERPLICVAGLGLLSSDVAMRAVVYRSFSRANHTLALCCAPDQLKALTRIAIDIAK